VSLLINIHYIRYGEKNEKCNFLDIPPEQRNELSKMASNCKEFDKDIEINIVKLGLLDREMREDGRIRKEIIQNIPPLCRGKALLPNELKKKYRSKKICYCCHNRDFNETITTIFHEIYHFCDPFDFKKCHSEKEKLRDNFGLKENLKYNIKAELSEFFAEYKIAKNLSNQSKFKDALMKKANLNFQFLRNELEFSKQTNQRFEKFSPNVELMDKIFGHKFNYLFRIIGIWRGFKKIDEYFILQKSWDDLNPFAQNDDYLTPDLFEYLKEQLLKGQIETLENSILRKFEEYFKTHLNFQF